jgi:hypothetical protein
MQTLAVSLLANYGLTHEHINDWVAVALFLILPVITNE